MIRRRKEEPQVENSLGWMLTFSDIITLLITFFVLIISMSSMNDKSIKRSITYFTGSPGLFGNEQQGSKNFIYFKERYRLTRDDFIKILEIISKYQVTEIKALAILKLEHTLGNKNNYDIEGDSAIINFKGNAFFIDFDYNFNERSKTNLKKLLTLCKNFTGYILIDVHTTKFPVSTPNIRDNVDLSAKRGVKIANFLIKNGIDKKRIEVMGWGYKKKSRDVIYVTLLNYLKTSKNFKGGL